jgi:hypothetical protein
VPRNRTQGSGQTPIPFTLSKGPSAKVFLQGFDKLSPNGNKAVRPELLEGRTADRRSP